MKRAFTLVEILIVVAIIGILAAIVIPTFQGHILEAKEAAAKDNLRVLRNAIELYAAQHNNVPPGYPDGRITSQPSPLMFIYQLCYSTNRSGQYSREPLAGYNFGPYLQSFPKNSFNDKWTIGFIADGQQFPEDPPENFAYLYKPSVKQIRLDSPGTDRNGIRYYDY